MKWVLVFWTSFFLFPSICSSQQPRKARLSVAKGKLVILRDTTFITSNDTVIYLTKKELSLVRVKENPNIESNRFYDSMRSKASKTKLTQGLVDLLVKRPAKELTINTTIQKGEDVFAQYAGYTIGNISFKSVDILEGSVIDTLQKAASKFAIFVNRVHKDTRAAIIGKNLLFKSGDKVDAFRMADNERVLRQFRTLRDARILLVVSDAKKKIVDVVVVTQDVNSIGFSGGYSRAGKFQLNAYDINILGYAKQLQISYFRNDLQKPINGYSITLRDPNINGSFIQGEVQYTNNYQRNQQRISVGRDFFTPEIKYAGGIELFTTNEKYYFEDTDTLQASYRENHSDFWLGRSFELKKRINLITSLRNINRNFFDRPFVSQDSNSFFFDRNLMLGSATLTKRNYLKSALIRGFGRTEDIPVGSAIAVLVGAEINEFVNRRYTEIRGNVGAYIPRYGYFNADIKMGTFIKNSVAEDGLFSAQATYFSNLFKIRRVRSRQFVTLIYANGINRVLDKTLKLEGGWRSTSSIAPFGLERLGLGTENVYFMPWYKLGFRFALYHKIDITLLSVDNNLFQEKNLFPSLGAGIRMVNENFVFPSFSIDVNHYIGNKLYASAFEINLKTSLPRLFGNDQVFKPLVTEFQ